MIGNGSNVLVFDANGAPIACQRNVDVTFNDEMIDVTCKQSNGYSEFLAGKRSFSMTCEALTDWGQNLLLWSEEFDNAVWGKVSGASVTPNTTIAPDGTLTADTINLDSTNGSRVEQTTINSSAGNYIYSIWLKGSGTITINLNVTTEETEETITLTNDWERYDVTLNVSAGAGNPLRAFVIWRPLNTANTIYAWGAQINTGTTAQSYYQTTSTVNPNIDTLVSANLNRTKVELNIANPAFDDIYFNGEAYVESIELNAGTETEASYTVTFSGTGDLASLVS